CAGPQRCNRGWRSRSIRDPHAPSWLSRHLAWLSRCWFPRHYSLQSPLWLAYGDLWVAGHALWLGAAQTSAILAHHYARNHSVRRSWLLSVYCADHCSRPAAQGCDWIPAKRAEFSGLADRRRHGVVWVDRVVAVRIAHVPTVRGACRSILACDAHDLP